jgi:hypothetical protein
MTEVTSVPAASWDQVFASAEQERALGALESGSVVLLPRLRFLLREDEEQLLSPSIAGDSKNVSLDPARGPVRGSLAAPAQLELLQSVMLRFAASSATLTRNLFPRYAAGLRRGRASFRPIEIEGRSTSWRKNDTRLHVDSFPSSPTRGARILRVFSNINPDARVRTWRLGEPFEMVVQGHRRALSGPVPGVSYLLERLGITKGRRSAYDHVMLRLHDRMKADLRYQSQAAQSVHEFHAGCTWIVFTDQVSHAAMAGQYALEQTFLVPLECMQDPSLAPLRILERVLGRELA